MAQGVSNSLNLALSRISYIEQSFAALENVANKNVSNSPIESDFKKILDNKIESKKENAPTPLGNLDEKIEPKEKEAINLKSKIDLKAQTTNVEELIETFSEKYNVDSNFVKAIIKQESGFNPNATSKKGAMGLMQLMPKTAESLGVIDAYDPSQNIEGGVKYLKGLLDRFDNKEELALAAYNAGPNAVKRYGGIPPYKETKNYINNIMSTYEKIKGANL